MSDNEMSFMEKLIGVITVPGETFKHITEKDIKKGLLIIIIVALLSGFAGSTYFSKMSLGPQLSDMQSQMAPFIALANAITYITRWLVPSLIIAVMAKLMIGEGNTKRLLAMTSYASMPLLIQQILRLIDSQIISSAEVGQVIASRFMGEGLLIRFLNQGLNVLNVFGLITLILTVYAVRENYGTSTGKAAQVTIVSYLAYILIRTFLPLI